MPGLIATARGMAERTPSDRNRYVDLLRAVSIVAVVVGHWLIAAPHIVDGEISGINMLAHSPWTQWLTWAFQVMPVFFMVGGYSNAVSWRSTLDRHGTYGTWLAGRLRRLLTPTAPLVVVWSVVAVLGHRAGLDPDLITLGSQAALVPVWFLAVYVMVVAVTPAVVAAWDRYGWASVIGLAGLALSIDLVGAAGPSQVGWINFLVVWATIHQVGVAWQRGSIGGVAKSLPLAVLAGALLMGLLTHGPYAISMVGVPGAEASNNSPPTVALLAFGLTQVALLLAIEGPARRMLDRLRTWTVVVLVNGLIMSLYLWHLTAMVLLVGVSMMLDGLGLAIEPGTGTWWLTRPVWIAALAVGTAPFVAAFARFDRVRSLEGDVSARLAVTALASGCLGMALLAGGGIQGPAFGLRIDAVVPALTAGLLLRQRRRRPGEAADSPMSSTPSHGCSGSDRLAQGVGPSPRSTSTARRASSRRVLAAGDSERSRWSSSG